MSQMSPSEVGSEMRRLSKLIDDGLDYLKRQTTEYAVAEDAYRMARAREFMGASGTVREREMTADLATSDQRQRAHMADGMRQAALEAIRSRRAQVSALQSLLNAHRAEAEFARTGPGVHP